MKFKVFNVTTEHSTYIVKAKDRNQAALSVVLITRDTIREIRKANLSDVLLPSVKILPFYEYEIRRHQTA